MKKLEKDLYIQHAKRMYAIIDEKSTFASFLTRPDFNNVLKNQLNVLFACEKLFTKVDLEAKYTAKSLVKNFNKLTKDKFKIDENFKYEDETDLIDAINYLYTFCNNMFKVNLDDLVAGKNITATDPKIDLRAKPSFDDEGAKVNPNFAFAGAGIPLAATPYENPYLLGKAYAKLNDDMKQGKFYRYKTQPRIIPIVKWFSFILMGLLSLSLILMGIFAFMANNLAVNDGSQDLILGGIGSGIIYILVAGFGIYTMTIVGLTLFGKNSKNLNLKYHFSWGVIVASLVLIFLMVMLDINKTWLIGFTIYDDPSSLPYIAWTGWRVMFLVACGLIGLNIIPIIFGSIFNPKPDPAAVDKKIKEYIDLFSAESGQSPVPPKADVQKPADVKETKKGKKKK